MLIINDRPDIAAIVGADGVHLGQSDLPLQESRRLLRPGAIVGRSTHNMDQVRTAANEGADYIAVGPIFQTATKDAGAPVGPQLVAEACRSLRVPVVAIGGITTENVAQVFAAGCSSVAVSSCVCSTADPRAAVEALQAKIAAARRSPAKE
jgi:thiamine-phosphate pyrophosphorylase